MPARSWSSSLPACPTNGYPCLSSWKPGASPTNIRSAPGSPAPKTTWVRPDASRHFVHPEVPVEYAASASRRLSTSGSAATGPAATTAAACYAAKARLPGGAVSREHGEETVELRRAAVGTRETLVIESHELLEMTLAGHADVLVNRHRGGSLSR